MMASWHGGQAVHRVPGEPADALRNNHLDLPGQRVRDHLVEALAPPGAHARNALVGVDLHKLPGLV